MLQVRLASAKVVSHSQLAPTKRQGKVITFGPYTNAPAFTVDSMHVHFENNSPFLHATRLVREIEVSHWGNVYVEEKYYIRSAAGLGCSHIAKQQHLQQDRSTGKIQKTEAVQACAACKSMSAGAWAC